MKNLAHFYDDAGMQHWAMDEDNHRNLKFMAHKATGPDDPWGGWASYKFTLKKHIYRFHPDMQYSRFKTKTGSLVMDRAIGGDSRGECMWFRMSDMSSARTTGQSVKDFERLHGSSLDRLFPS